MLRADAKRACARLSAVAAGLLKWALEPKQFAILQAAIVMMLDGAHSRVPARQALHQAWWLLRLCFQAIKGSITGLGMTESSTACIS